MNVLIADDESLVRSSLRSMLSELELPIQVVGEAKNGEELVELAEKLAPDLVFVDIRMPKLNGLDAIQLVKDRCPSTQWVVLTGFAEFDYARNALKLGAKEYLLKPATPEDLHSCIRRAYETYVEDLAAANRHFEQDILLLTTGAKSVADMDTSAYYRSFQCRATVFYLDSFLNESKKMELRARFVHVLHQCSASKLTHRGVRFAITTLHNGNLALFMAWDASSSLNSSAALRKEFHQCVEHEAALFNNSSCLLTAYQTEASSDLGQISEQLRVIEACSPSRSVQAGRFLPYPEVVRMNKQTELQALGQHLETLCRLFTEKDYVHYSKEHAFLKKAFTDKLLHDAKVVQAVCNFLQCAIDFEISFSLRDDTEKWFAALLSHGEKMLSERSPDEKLQGDWIQLVIQYVNHNYMNDIGIGQIAGEFNVTPNYLSSLFHKKQGVTFVKFLTETRMLKAKELLLKHPAMKVQEAAEKVGYHSTRHFTKLFSEYFGFYPSELRERALHI
ncbi:response regulator transcription factor [Paenibacillus aestuarii]|uniref:Response regulator n=1 Tax=Paenibacillus aestuarii TaxID=516965 RepID=A0ABW0KBD2_9BACL|nr:response regulator [Paenibacillus aestuarii]